MRYRITLAYDGSAFCGWQVQSNAPTVQGTLQEKLSMLLGSPVEVVGAGRTDTNVNASFYVAHFDSCCKLDTAQLRYRLNAVLPRQIAVSSISPADDNFNARFSAVSRQYKYFIHSEKDPFKDKFSWYCRFKLDIDEMNRACSYLIGIHDCSCFEKTGSDNSNSLCDIRYAHWEESVDGNGCRNLVFTIEANRFLRNMVRAIVGTMVDIGRGLHKADHIRDLLSNGTRNDAGQSVPGHALFLSNIVY